MADFGMADMEHLLDRAAPYALVAVAAALEQHEQHAAQLNFIACNAEDDERLRQAERKRRELAGLLADLRKFTEIANG